MKNKLALTHKEGWKIEISFIGNVPDAVVDAFRFQIVGFALCKFTDLESSKRRRVSPGQGASNVRKAHVARRAERRKE